MAPPPKGHIVSPLSILSCPVRLSLYIVLGPFMFTSIYYHEYLVLITYAETPIITENT